jgi:hypothetical protein
MSDQTDERAHHIEPVGDDYPVDEAPKARRSAKGAAIVGVRVVGGAVGIAVAVAAIAVAALVPLPTIQSPPEAITVTPVPTAQELVCPGSLLRLGDESGEGASTASAIGDAVPVYGATGGEVTASPVAESGSPGSPLLISSPVGSGADDDVLVAAAQSQLTDRRDFSGLAAAQCAAVASETWLAGGSTAVGRTTLVTLANPSDTVSTVSLDIASEDGPVVAPGATGIVVQPHSQRVLSLAGFAPDVESPVVHVASRGGQVVANLQQATVRGLEAGGVEVIGATGSPATSHVVPGVVVAGSVDLASRLGEEGYADLGGVVRVYVPGDEPTTARVSVIADDGAPTGTSFSVPLEPGVVDDLALEGLVDGSYTVSVETTVPVVVGVRVSTVGPSTDPTRPGPTDFAWLAAADRLSDTAVVTVADGPNPRIHLVNASTEEEQVTITADDGTELELVLGAESSASVPAVAGETYELAGFDALVGAVSYSGGGIAGYTVRPPAQSAGPIRVLP